MSEKEKAKKLAKSIAADMRRLSELLINKRLIEDSSILETAAADCINNVRKPNRSQIYLWQYQIYNLKFPELSDRYLGGVLPANAKKVFVEMSIDVKGICLKDSDIEDPFDSLGVNVVITGMNSENSEIKCAWHLDRDLKTHENNPSKYLHPRYHFQYGGEKISHLTEHGNHIVLESPRLPHFPLDGILTIDFILSNYYGEMWTELKSEDVYTDIIRNAQKRFWRPYALSIASRWSNQNSNWHYRDILPQVVEQPITG